MTKQEIMIKIKEVLILVNENHLNVSIACKSVGITPSTFYRNICYDDVLKKFVLIGESDKLERAIKFLEDASKQNIEGYIYFCIVEALKCLKEVQK